MEITSNDALNVYKRLVESSIKYYKHRKYLKSLYNIIAAASWMYRFNVIFTDPQLEEIIHHISSHNIEKRNIATPKSENVVFIDNFGLDNRGLTQQYLRGLMAINKRILYILHNSSPNENSEIIRELSEYENCNIYIFKTDKCNLLETATEISNKIFDFSPKEILIHITPWDVVTLLALSSLSGASKYNLNLTDHAYWLGSLFIDYNIEFRGYGEQLSLQKRNLKKSQLLRLPYYPIVSKYTSFKGFPPIPDDSVIVFCGGAEYKMLGKNGIFFSLMDTILDISDKVYILVAGIKNNSVFSDNVSKMKNRKRVLLIGSRSDINEVFKHSDIYLSSYPFFGGLMTQYAAYNHLPIIAYTESDDIVGKADYMVNHLGKAMKSRESLGELKEYAKKLIDNVKFREEEGNANHNALINENDFNKYLDKILCEHKTDIDFLPEQPLYDKIIDFYIEIENKTHAAIITLVHQMKFKSIAYIPKYIFYISWVILKAVKNKIRKIPSSFYGLL